MPNTIFNMKSLKMAIFQLISNQERSCLFTKMAAYVYIKEMKKRQQINLRKGVPLLQPFPSSGQSPIAFFWTYDHESAN